VDFLRWEENRRTRRKTLEARERTNNTFNQITAQYFCCFADEVHVGRHLENDKRTIEPETLQLTIDENMMRQQMLESYGREGKCIICPLIIKLFSYTL
jgi:hypothetical protein